MRSVWGRRDRIPYPNSLDGGRGAAPGRDLRADYSSAIYSARHFLSSQLTACAKGTDRAVGCAGIPEGWFAAALAPTLLKNAAMKRGHASLLQGSYLLRGWGGETSPWYFPPIWGKAALKHAALLGRFSERVVRSRQRSRRQGQALRPHTRTPAGGTAR